MSIPDRPPKLPDSHCPTCGMAEIDNHCRDGEGNCDLVRCYYCKSFGKMEWDSKTQHWMFRWWHEGA